MSPHPRGATWDAQIVGRVSPHCYYGWVIVGLGFIAQIFTSFSAQGLSTYVGPLQREFGWSASATAAGRSFQQVDSVIGPLNGWLVDRFGPRAMMSTGVILFTIAFIAFSYVDSLWQYYGACVLMALANSFSGLLVVSYALNRWFRRRRATAMGFAVTGFAVAGMVFIPVTVWLQSAYGWRAAALQTAAIIFILGIPIFLLTRDTPEAYGLLPDGDDPANQSGAHARASGGGLVNFTVAQALRTRAYWQITAGTTIAMFVQSAIVVHQFPYFEDLIDRDTAAWILAELNVFNIAGRILGGMLGDRMPKHHLMAFNLFSSMLGMLLLAFGATLVPFLIYGAFFGFAWGVRAAVSNSLLGDYFGRAAFGRIAGIMQTLVAPFSIVAPIVVGLVLDLTGGYQAPFLVLAALALIGTALFLMASRPADPRPHPTAT
ncbi:MAG: MFS transporter [Chloroflexota bacterium]